MKIQCDVCEKAQATVICCADEAALCGKCDVEVHAANKLANKHQRLHLDCFSNKLPSCDICQERTAFIFCVEDRALFCKNCDESIHSTNSLAANHQRFLATGIRVALSSSSCNNNKQDLKSQTEPKPPKSNPQHNNALKTATQHVSAITSHSWAVDDLLQFSDYESSNKKGQLDELNELAWLTDVNFFNEQVCPEVGEVPQLPQSRSSDMDLFRPARFYGYNKKPRIEVQDDNEDEEYYTVPNLG